MKGKDTNKKHDVKRQNWNILFLLLYVKGLLFLDKKIINSVEL